MTDSISSVRREIAHTRERMTETIDEIEGEISDRANAVKRKMDVMQYAREHPWPALSVAVAIGALIGGSGADEKAASATAIAAKRAASATSDAAKNLVAKVKERRSSSKAEPFRHAETRAENSGPGFGDRIIAAATAPLGGAIDRLLDELRVASRDLGERLARSGSRRRMAPISSVTEVDVVVAARPTPTDTRVPRAEDVVPVPREMLPTEVDARADAVEALGGGTHEPPLEPGAGDLGARWA
jgi:hypothetical protein